MALFQSTILSAVSGSLNGTVFSRNASGAYMRNKTIPVNPHTDAQSLVRGSFSQSSHNWKLLTQGQRDAWTAYAASLVRHNKIGQVITISGIAAYVMTNFYQQYIGNALLTSAPPGGAIPLPTESEYGMVSSATEITPQYSPVFTSGQNVLRWISPPQSKGVKFFNGPWLALPTVTGDNAEDPIDVETALPGYNYSDDNINFFIRLVYIDSSNRVSERLITGPYPGVTLV